jgi:hypothetical protein
MDIKKYRLVVATQEHRRLLILVQGLTNPGRQVSRANKLCTLAQFVEALRYKPEGCGFDYRWCHWNFSLA